MAGSCLSIGLLFTTSYLYFRASRAFNEKFCTPMTAHYRIGARSQQDTFSPTSERSYMRVRPP